MIPVNTALIEFAAYRPYNPKATKQDEAFGAPHYVAYVIRRQGDVQWKELGEAKVIDAVIDNWRKALRDPKRKDVKALARVVDEKTMQPLRPLLGAATQLLISPESALNLIPFPALVNETGQYLVERYAISYLTSGRDLLRLQVARESQSPPLVLAYPEFGEGEMIQRATAPTSKRAAQTRQGISPATDLTSLYFTALKQPEDKKYDEAKSIQSNFPTATVLTETFANETALKQVKSPRILHIATHGFFLTDQKIEASHNTGAVLGINLHVKIENPLLRSGLALAGANLRKESNDDGILTAMEMANLNLWGTKLVTLSACETGVGEVKIGEGVYGLRRALVLAGAESQVMSLWKVSADKTPDLMIDYYAGLKQGQGRGEALRQAQLKMLRNKALQHPFFWAGFIQSGEWANLDGKR